MKKILTTIVVLFLVLTTANIAASFQISPEGESLKGKKVQERFDYDQKYAVIIIGTYGSKNQENISGYPREQYYDWYTRSAMTRFNILTEKYCFDAKNIYVLLTEVHEEGYEPSPNFNSSKFVNYYNSTKENITMVFDELKTIMDDDDFLEVDLVGHGGDNGILRTPIFTKLTGKRIDINYGRWAHDTYMGLEKREQKVRSITLPRFDRRMFNLYNLSSKCFNNYKLYDYELACLTKDIDARRVLFVLHPCFSGGFINDLSKKNHVIITSAKECELADDFLGPFNRAINGSADLNEDGRISLAEVFNYTIAQPQISGFHPLLDDNGDKRGHQDLSYDDGYIAAGIYDLSYEEIGDIPDKSNRKNSEFLEGFPVLERFFQLFF